MRKITSAIAGGFVGGSLIGLLEALVIAASGGAQEFGVFRFGAISYGLIGAGMGAGIGVGTLVLPFLARTGAHAAGLAGGGVAALLGLAVARFRIVRDVFAENLPIASGSGILVHVGLLVAAVLVFWLVRRALVSASRDGDGTVAAAKASAALVLVGIALAAVLNVTMTGGGPTPEPGTAQGPNVILIIADTLRADHVGAYGSTATKTPHMDRLARDGVTFEKAYAQSSWTRPSVATIVTSMYASSHKVMHKTDLLPKDVTTLAEAMRDAGYRTAGYVTNINVAPSFHFEQGFQEYEYLAPEFFFGASDSGSKLAFYSGMRLIRARFLAKDKWVQHFYQDADTVNAGTLPWLERNAREPFFTLVHYMDPHDPYFEIPYNGKAIARVDTPNPDPAMRERMMELYADNIEYLDGFIGKLLDALEKAGVYDDTAIALVADHGEEFLEHGGWWHGLTLYDEQLHVPFLLKLPKGERRGTRVSGPVQMLDVAPTLLGAAGVDKPSAWQGRDLFSDAPAPAALFAEEDHEGNVLRSLRKGRWKLILANEGNPRGLPPVELFDIEADPGERRNVAAEHPDVIAELTSDLDAVQTMARSAAVAGETGEIDAAAQERLRALGYVE